MFVRVAGSKACRLQMSTLVVQITRLLTPLVNEADKGALLPSRHVSLVVAVSLLGRITVDSRPSRSSPGVACFAAQSQSNIDLVQSNAALAMLNMVSTADCPAALLSSDREGLEITLPTFARLQREADVVGTGGDSSQFNKKEPKLVDHDDKPLLPSAMTAGKTREYVS